MIESAITKKGQLYDTASKSLCGKCLGYKSGTGVRSYVIFKDGGADSARTPDSAGCSACDAAWH